MLARLNELDWSATSSLPIFGTLVRAHHRPEGKRKATREHHYTHVRYRTHSRLPVLMRPLRSGGKWSRQKPTARTVDWEQPADYVADTRIHIRDQNAASTLRQTTREPHAESTISGFHFDPATSGSGNFLRCLPRRYCYHGSKRIVVGFWGAGHRRQAGGLALDCPPGSLVGHRAQRICPGAEHRPVTGLAIRPMESRNCLFDLESETPILEPTGRTSPS